MELHSDYNVKVFLHKMNLKLTINRIVINICSKIVFNLFW